MTNFETKQIQTKNQFFVWVQQQIQVVSTFGSDQSCCRRMRLTKSSEGLIFKNIKNDNNIRYYDVDRPLTRKSNTRIKNNVARIDFLPSPVGRGGNRKAAFTLAEVLITLGIIGVVAAMTLPTLITKYQKQEVVSKLRKAYTVLNQMVLRSYADNGPISNYLESNEVSEENSKKFFDNYILPYFNAPKVHTKTPYESVTPYKLSEGGDTWTISVGTNYPANRILFSTRDGIIYFMIFSTSEAQYTDARVYIDINGTRKPNAFGKDVFEATIDLTKNIVSPYHMDGYDDAIKTPTYYCNANRFYCFRKIVKDGWEIKDDYPW